MGVFRDARLRRPLLLDLALSSPSSSAPSEARRVFDVEKGGSVETDVDERGLHAGQHARHATEVGCSRRGSDGGGARRRARAKLHRR